MQDHPIALEYFQSAASIIPTLAIAMAVSSGVMKVQLGKDPRIWFLAEHRVRNVIIAACFLSLFASGEMICLATLATKNPTHLGMYVVLIGIVFMFWLVLYNSIAPMLDEMKLKMAKYAALIGASGIAVLFAVFFIFFISLGGSLK